MNIWTVALLASLLLCGAVRAQSMADFYVAPDGNDRNLGSRAKPFATLTRARDAVRKRKQAAPNRDFLVLLRGGVYPIHETVRFSVQDGASEGNTITYAAQPGETPILSTGVPLTGWRRLTEPPAGLPQKAHGKVWVTQLPTGLRPFSTLYDGTKRLPRARSLGFRPSEKAKGKAPDQTLIRFPEGKMRNWPNLRDAEIVIVPASPWTMNILPLASVDETNRIAHTAIPGTYALTQPRFGHFAQSIWVENVLEALDTPGEWVLDSKRRRLYLWPLGDRPSDAVTAPALTEIIRVEGEIDEEGPTDRPVQGLRFRGLTFTHADRFRWEKDRQGWGLQHDWEMFDRPTAMLRLRGAERCVVEQCHFHNSGASAVRLDLHCLKNRVDRNHIEHVGGVGILLAGYGPGTKDVNRENEVTNNHIHHVGELLWHSPAIFVWQSGHNKIAHNHLHNTPYSGIVVSGRIVWDRRGERECSRTVRWHELEKVLEKPAGSLPWRRREPFLHGRRNVVEYNDIHHCMHIMGDGNGIYVSGTGNANQIRYNAIHDVDSPSMNAAIRCDDDQHGTVIHGNIIANCSGEGFIIKGANTITNNIVYGLSTRTPNGTLCVHRRGYLVFPYGDCTGAVIEQNIFYATEKGTPVLTESLNRKALLRQCRADKNLYFNIADSKWGPRHLAVQRKHGIEKHSIAADPLFVDISKGNFRLKPDSPALKLGFEPIDMNLIGLTEDFPKRYR